MNEQHHDLNDVRRRLDKLVVSSAELLKVTNALLLVSGHQIDLFASIDASLKSIDAKIQPPSDEDIETDKVTIAPLTQKET